MSEGFCQFCGAATASDARFCAKCGKAVPHAAAAPAATPATPAAAPSASETTVFELRPLVIRTTFEMLLCILTVGIAWVVYWCARMGLRYIVTTQRIETRRGVVSRTRDSLDLFRIEDFEVVEPFFLRMRGAGNLRLWSMDKDEPDLVLVAIPDVQNVFDTLRNLTREERRRNQVRVVDVG